MESKNEVFKSECAKLRKYLAPYCQGCGIELGSGGDRIVPNAITVDLNDPYADVGENPIQLKGDARDLYWFKDNALDFVHSAHLLEDFPNTIEIMQEWSRVLKVGGYLALNLPHEKMYRECCKNSGQTYNSNHSIEEMSSEYIIECAKSIPELELVYETEILYSYSFGIVFKKIARS